MEKFTGAIKRSRQLAHRDDVDGLRAIAVLVIFAFHLNLTGFAGGFVGVDIFFVISGYVILRSILPDLESGSFALRDFFIRRMRRILPALTVVVAAVVAAGSVILSPAELKELAESALATLAFGANFYFHDRTGYFASAAHARPLLHMWSLSIEEQFYILVPLLLAVLARRRALSAAKVLLILAIVSFGYALIATTISEKNAFYMPMARFWELAVGGCVAVVERRWGLVRRGSSTVAILGLLGIAASVVLLDGGYGGPQWNIVSVVSTAAVIAAGAAGRGPVAAALASRPMVTLGRLSYSIYLVHWPLIVFWRLYVARPLVPYEQVLIVFIAIALAAVLSSVVETPLRAGSRRFGNKPVLAGTFAATVAVAALGAAVMFDRGAEWRMNPTAKEALASLRAAVAERPRCTTDMQWLGGAFPVCRWNQVTQATDYVFWGDSHMGMLAPELATMLGNGGTSSGVSVAMPDCSPLHSVVVASRKSAKLCPVFVDAVLRAIERDKPKVVVIAARWATLESDVRAPGDGGRSGRILDLENSGTPMALADALFRTIERVIASGTQVLVIGPVPEIEYDVPKTLVRSLQGFGRLPPVSRDDFDIRQKRVLSALARMQALKKVTVVYPHRVLCNADTCAVAEGNRSLYMDDDHLSPFGSARVVTLIRSVIYPSAAARVEPGPAAAAN